MAKQNRKQLSQEYIDDHMIYKFIRGSHCHGISTPLSDIDYGGIYQLPNSTLYGLEYFKNTHWSDSTNDKAYYEIGKFMELLTKSNPTILEYLFVDEEFIVKTSETFDMLRANRDKFITKKCFNSFFMYGKEQLKKARGLNKKIYNEVQYKSPFEFCYTFNGIGSYPMQKFLEDNGYVQERCGLVNLANMPMMYAVFYDKDGTLGYKGIISENSHDVRLSSIPKGETPICYMSYNSTGYIHHCRLYKDYTNWVKYRNPVRYESNLEKNYDSKNMCECFRLLHTGLEIAKGEGVHVNRRDIDGDFLLKVKRHEYEYDELMEMAEQAEKDMMEAQKKSTLPDTIDINMVNDLLLEIRNRYS